MRSRAMSLILALVRSFMRSQAPVPRRLMRGGSPSLPLYLLTLCRACMLT